MKDEDDLRIVIIYNYEDAITRGKPQDLIALQDTAQCAQAINEALRARGYQTRTIAIGNSLDEFEKELLPLPRQSTFLFNVCDGLNGVNLGAIKIVRLIEKLGFKHTGSPADVISICINKKRTKEKLIRHGISTPRFQVFYKPTGVVGLNFPVIVKPLNEDGSIGIDLDSVVNDKASLFSRINYVIETYYQPAIVEEFIAGRELAISMWGNHEIEVLPVYEDDYSRIPDPHQWLLTFEAKWLVDSPYYQNITTTCPAALDPTVEQRVIQTAKDTYRTIGLRDFGRVDLRLFAGIPYVIDVNELPDLAPESGFPKTAGIAGYRYEDMAERILDLALRREGWR